MKKSHEFKGNVGFERLYIKKMMRVHSNNLENAKASHECRRWKDPKEHARVLKFEDGKKKLHNKMIEKRNDALVNRIFGLLTEPRQKVSSEYAPGFRRLASGGIVIDCYSTTRGLNYKELHGGRYEQERRCKGIEKSNMRLHDHLANVQSPFRKEVMDAQYKQNRAISGILLNRISDSALHLGLKEEDNKGGTGRPASATRTMGSPGGGKRSTKHSSSYDLYHHKKTLKEQREAEEASAAVPYYEEFREYFMNQHKAQGQPRGYDDLDRNDANQYVPNYHPITRIDGELLNSPIPMKRTTMEINEERAKNQRVQQGGDEAQARNTLTYDAYEFLASTGLGGGALLYDPGLGATTGNPDEGVFTGSNNALDRLNSANDYLINVCHACEDPVSNGVGEAYHSDIGKHGQKSNFVGSMRGQQGHPSSGGKQRPGSAPSGRTGRAYRLESESYDSDEDGAAGAVRGAKNGKVINRTGPEGLFKRNYHPFAPDQFFTTPSAAQMKEKVQRQQQQQRLKQKVTDNSLSPTKHSDRPINARSAADLKAQLLDRNNIAVADHPGGTGAGPTGADTTKPRGAGRYYNDYLASSGVKGKAGEAARGKPLEEAAKRKPFDSVKGQKEVHKDVTREEADPDTVDASDPVALQALMVHRERVRLAEEQEAAFHAEKERERAAAEQNILSAPPYKHNTVLQPGIPAPVNVDWQSNTTGKQQQQQRRHDHKSSSDRSQMADHQTMSNTELLSVEEMRAAETGVSVDASHRNSTSSRAAAKRAQGNGGPGNVLGKGGDSPPKRFEKLCQSPQGKKLLAAYGGERNAHFEDDGDGDSQIPDYDNDFEDEPNDLDAFDTANGKDTRVNKSNSSRPTSAPATRTGAASARTNTSRPKQQHRAQNEKAKPSAAGTAGTLSSRPSSAGGSKVSSRLKEQLRSVQRKLPPEQQKRLLEQSYGRGSVRDSRNVCKDEPTPFLAGNALGRPSSAPSSRAGAKKGDDLVGKGKGGKSPVSPYTLPHPSSQHTHRSPSPENKSLKHKPEHVDRNSQRPEKKDFGIEKVELPAVLQATPAGIRLRQNVISKLKKLSKLESIPAKHSRNPFTMKNYINANSWPFTIRIVDVGAVLSGRQFGGVYRILPPLDASDSGDVGGSEAQADVAHVDMRTSRGVVVEASYTLTVVRKVANPERDGLGSGSEEEEEEVEEQREEYPMRATLYLPIRQLRNLAILSGIDDLYGVLTTNIRSIATVEGAEGAEGGDEAQTQDAQSAGGIHSSQVGESKRQPPSSTAVTKNIYKGVLYSSISDRLDETLQDKLSEMIMQHVEVYYNPETKTAKLALELTS